MAKSKGLTRRQFTRLAGRSVLIAGAATFPAPFVRAADPIVINHWSYLGASDAEVWAQMIQSFNDAHKDKGVQIQLQEVSGDQYNTKILAAAASGKAPDFGWGTAGLRAQWANDGVTVALDDLVKTVGLDLSDF